MGQHPSKPSSDDGKSPSSKSEPTEATGAIHDQCKNYERPSLTSPKKDIPSMPFSTVMGTNLPNAVRRSGFLVSPSTTRLDDASLLSEPLFKKQHTFDGSTPKHSPFSCTSTFSSLRPNVNAVSQHQDISSSEKCETNTIRRQQLMTLKRIEGNSVWHNQRLHQSCGRPSRIEGGMSRASSSSCSSIFREKPRRSKTLRGEVQLRKLKHMKSSPWWQRPQPFTLLGFRRKKILVLKVNPQTSEPPEPSLEGSKSAKKLKNRKLKVVPYRRWAAKLPRIGASTNLGSRSNFRLRRRLRRKMFAEWLSPPKKTPVSTRRMVAPSHQHFLHPPSFYYSESTKRSMLSPRPCSPCRIVKGCKLIPPQNQVKATERENVSTPSNSPSSSVTSYTSTSRTQEIQEKGNGENDDRWECLTDENSTNDNFSSYINVHTQAEEHLPSMPLCPLALMKTLVIADEKGEDTRVTEYLDNSVSSSESRTTFSELPGSSTVTTFPDKVNWHLSWGLDYKQPINQKERMAAGKDSWVPTGAADATQKSNEHFPNSKPDVLLNQHNQTKVDNRYTQTAANGKSLNSCDVSRNLSRVKDWSDNSGQQQLATCVSPTATTIETYSTTEDPDSDRTTQIETDESWVMRDLKMFEGTQFRRVQICQGGMNARFPQKTCVIPVNHIHETEATPVPRLLLTESFCSESSGVAEQYSSMVSVADDGIQIKEDSLVLTQETPYDKVGKVNQTLLEQAEDENGQKESYLLSPEKDVHCNKVLNHYSDAYDSKVCINKNRQESGADPSTRDVSNELFAPSEIKRVGEPVNYTGSVVLPQLVISNGSSQSSSPSSSETSCSSLLSNQYESCATVKDTKLNRFAQTLQVLKSALQAATKWGEQVICDSDNCQTDVSTSSYYSSETTSSDDSEGSSTLEEDESSSTIERPTLASSLRSNGTCTGIPATYFQCQNAFTANGYCMLNDCKSKLPIKLCTSIPTTGAQEFTAQSTCSSGQRRTPLVCPHVARLTGRGILVTHSLGCNTEQQKPIPSNISPELSVIAEKSNPSEAKESESSRISITPTQLSAKLDNVQETYDKGSFTDNVITKNYSEKIGQTIETKIEATVASEDHLTQNRKDEEKLTDPRSSYTSNDKCWPNCSLKTFGRHVLPDSLSPEFIRIHRYPYQAKFRSKRLEKHYNSRIRSMPKVSFVHSKATVISKVHDTQEAMAARLNALRWLEQHQNPKLRAKKDNQDRNEYCPVQVKSFHRPYLANTVSEYFLVQTFPTKSHAQQRNADTKPYMKPKKGRPVSVPTKCHSCQVQKESETQKFLCIHLPSVTLKNYKEKLSHAKTYSYLSQCHRKSEDKIPEKGGHKTNSSKAANRKPKDELVSKVTLVDHGTPASDKLVTLDDSFNDKTTNAADESENSGKEHLRGPADTSDDASGNNRDVVKKAARKKKIAVEYANSDIKSTDACQTCTCTSSLQNPSCAPLSVCICRHQSCISKPSETHLTRRRHVVVVAKHPPHTKKVRRVRVTLGSARDPLDSDSQQNYKSCPTANRQCKTTAQNMHSNCQKSQESIAAGGERTIGVCVKRLSPRSSAAAWKEVAGVEELLGLHSGSEQTTSNARQCRLVEQSHLQKYKIGNASEPETPQAVSKSKQRISLVEQEGIHKVNTPLSTKIKNNLLTMAPSCKISKDKMKPIWQNVLPVELLSASEALRRQQGSYQCQPKKEIMPKYVAKQALTTMPLSPITPTPTPTPTTVLTLNDSLPSLCNWSLSSSGPPHQTIPKKCSNLAEEAVSSTEQSQNTGDSF